MLWSGILAVCCPFLERAAKESATKRAHHRCLCAHTSSCCVQGGLPLWRAGKICASPARLQGQTPASGCAGRPWAHDARRASTSPASPRGA